MSDQIEWLDRMLKRWHSSGAPVDEINRLIEVKDQLRKLEAVREQADLYRYHSNTYGQPDHRTAMVGRQLDEALADCGDES